MNWSKVYEIQGSIYTVRFDFPISNGMENTNTYYELKRQVQSDYILNCVCILKIIKI